GVVIDRASAARAVGARGTVASTKAVISNTPRRRRGDKVVKPPCIRCRGTGRRLWCWLTVPGRDGRARPTRRYDRPANAGRRAENANQPFLKARLTVGNGRARRQRRANPGGHDLRRPSTADSAAVVAPPRSRPFDTSLDRTAS